MQLTCVRASLIVSGGMNDKRDSSPPGDGDPADQLRGHQEPQEAEVEEEEGLFKIILAQETRPIEPFLLGLLIVGVILAGTAFFMTHNTVMFFAGVLLMAVPYVYVLRLKARARGQRSVKAEPRDK
jgi:Flp pilus assembly protein TadB